MGGRCYFSRMQYLGALVAFPVAMLLTMGMNWIALFRFPSEAVHWTLRARKLYPIRISAGLNIFLIPATLGAAHFMASHGQEPLLSAVLIMSAWAGAVMGSYFLNKKSFLSFHFRFGCDAFGEVGSCVSVSWGCC